MNVHETREGGKMPGLIEVMQRWWGGGLPLGQVTGCSETSVPEEARRDLPLGQGLAARPLGQVL